MDLQALQLTLRDFAAARHWQPFHTPKNLSTALVVEAAELAEIFQWMTSEESQAAHLYPATKVRIADEVADVLLYLLQLADHSAIDIQSAAANKMAKNALKYPAKTPLVPKPATAPVAEALQQTHVLVDWENVQPKDVDIQALVPLVTDIWLFHGPNQKNMATKQAMFGERATLVPISRAGKNALDFHLSFYMGYIASRNPHANFVVMSNDTGYLPMLEHARSLGFSVRQLGFLKPRVASRKAVAGTEVADALSRAVVRKLPKEVTMLTGLPAKSSAVTKRVIAPKAMVTKNGTMVKAPIATAKSAKPSKKANLAKVREDQIARVTPPKAKAKVAAEAEKAMSDRPAKVLQPPTKLAKSQPTVRQEKFKLVLDFDNAVRHVQASLQKSVNKPSRKVRLLASIKSLLNESSSEATIVTKVMTELVKIGFVEVDSKGAVRFNP